jgi:glycosyltransferase involved in cell wall biosynthesis
MASGGSQRGLSVAIIVRDAAEQIEACLASVAWADEIVVSDSGSRDGTPAICRAYGARVFLDDWLGYGAQKNRCVERVAGPWVLSLDSDERVTPALRVEIEKVLADGTNQDAFAVPRRNYFLGRWVRHGGWSPDYCPRLFRKGRARFSERLVHEALEVPSGRVRRLQGALEHFTYASISDYLERMDRYAALGAAQLQAEGRRARVADLLVRPPLTFLRMLILRQGWRDGTLGVVLAGLYGCATLVKYARLWELGREEG